MSATAPAVAADVRRILGTVRWFHDGKGYGFITADDGRDLFVHFSGLIVGRDADGRRNLSQRQRVSFDVQLREKGPVAINVQTID